MEVFGKSFLKDSLIVDIVIHGNSGNPGYATHIL